MGKFEFIRQENGGKLEIKIIGIIDEDTDFQTCPIAEAKEIHLKLKDIKSINSCGIREWIKWLAQNPMAKTFWYECPKVIVDQINLVDGFLPPNSLVESFFVPYFNEESEEEKQMLFTRGKEFSDSNLQSPEVKDSSGNLMEMDVIEAKYFKFLKGR